MTLNFPRRRSASVSVGMDRDFAAAHRARAALPDSGPFLPAPFPSRAAYDADPVLYRPAHSPPNEPTSSAAAMASPKAADEERRRRLRSGGPRRRRPSPPGEGGGGADSPDAGGGGGGDGSVYTQLQTELYPHMNFF